MPYRGRTAQRPRGGMWPVSGAASLDDAARDTKRQGDMRCGVRGLEGLHRRAPARPAGRAGGGASRAGGPAAPRSPSAGVSPHRRSAAPPLKRRARKRAKRVHAFYEQLNTSVHLSVAALLVPRVWIDDRASCLLFCSRAATGSSAKIV